MSIPISYGAGTASIASEKVGNNDYQQIKVIDGTTSSTNKWIINSDGSAQVSILGIPNVNVSGSVFATLSGAGSIIAISTGSVIAVLQSSSIIGVVTGSVLAIPTGNQSVSGTVGASVIGWVPIQASNTSVITVAQGSIAVAIVSGSIVAIVTPPANQSVSGQIGASVIGWVPIQASNTSILTIWQSPSIVGSYAEDAAHTTGDKGLLALQVRNDNMTSITSADGDYSPQAVGPTGEVLTANAPITKWIRGTADLRVVLGSSVTAIAAQGASIFTYITSIQLANMGSASVLVTFTGGLGSILGYSIAPAGGGSNIYYPNALKTGENSAFAASISGTASVLVSAQGFTAKI